jgi:HlyD family secretion protein
MHASGFKLEPSAPSWRGRVRPVRPARDDEPGDHDGKVAVPRLRGRRWRKRAALIGACILLMIAGATLWAKRGSAPASYRTAPVERGDVVRVTTASGMVNPVETVQIGSYVSGRIQDLLCDYNSKVAKGQPCAKIDPRTYQAAVEQAAAAVSTAKAQLGKDRASFAYQKLVYERNLALSQRGVASQDAVENAFNAFQQAQAQVDLDRATIDQREAELKTARVNLEYTDIISPVEGTVVSRSVAIGQTVAASFQTPTLFLIATDLTRMQVDANVTEAAIGEIHEGQKVTFTVEAFADRTFAGTVTQVRQAPVSVQNVISYDVVVEVANPELLLKPGMTATTRIVVAEHDGVLRVPEQALRFAPAGLAAERANADARQQGQVWVMRDASLVRIPVTLGLRDDTDVEVTSGDFRPGDRVVVARERGAATQAAPQP